MSLSILSKAAFVCAAARYQMLILFLIAANTGTGVVLAVFAAYASLVDNQHRVRSENIFRRVKRDKIEQRLQGWALKVGFLSNKLFCLTIVSAV